MALAGALAAGTVVDDGGAGRFCVLVRLGDAAAVTNELGQFQLDGVPAGRHRLLATEAYGDGPLRDETVTVSAEGRLDCCEGNRIRVRPPNGAIPTNLDKIGVTCREAHGLEPLHE